MLVYTVESEMIVCVVKIVFAYFTLVTVAVRVYVAEPWRYLEQNGVAVLQVASLDTLTALATQGWVSSDTTRVARASKLAKMICAFMARSSMSVGGDK